MTGNNILTPRMPMVNKDGIVTREWWRFFNSLFILLGGYQSGGNGGQPVDLTILYNLAFSQFGRSGPDYQSEIGDIQTYLATLPSPQGRMAELEARVKQLETLLAQTAQPRTDLTNLQREADVSRALTLGVRH